MISDIEIAQKNKMEPIVSIANTVGLCESDSPDMSMRFTVGNCQSVASGVSVFFFIHVSFWNLS